MADMFPSLSNKKAFLQSIHANDSVMNGPSGCLVWPNIWKKPGVFGAAIISLMSAQTRDPKEAVPPLNTETWDKDSNNKLSSLSRQIAFGLLKSALSMPPPLQSRPKSAPLASIHPGIMPACVRITVRFCALNGAVSSKQSLFSRNKDAYLWACSESNLVFGNSGQMYWRSWFPRRSVTPSGRKRLSAMIASSSSRACSGVMSSSGKGSE